MAEPLDLLQQTIRRNRERLRAVQPGHVELLLEISREAQAEVQERVRQLDPTRFSSQRAGVVLAQLNDVIDELGREVGDDRGAVVADLGTEAAGIAQDDLRAQLGAWSGEHPGAARAIVRIDEAGEALRPGLLEHFEVSRLRYGDQAIADMRTSLALSLANDETMIQAAGRLGDTLGLEDWQAERIVRTEQSNAFHRQWIEEARADLGDDVEDFRKELVATFDPRTGTDSIFVHGQRRRMDEEFIDDKGRRYQHPPNRPNDRETVILVLSDEPSTAAAERREFEAERA